TGTLEVDARGGFDERARRADAHATDRVRHLDDAVEGDETGEVVLDAREVLDLHNDEGQPAVGQRGVDRQAGASPALGTLGVRNDHVAREAHRGREGVVRRYVQQDGDVVQCAAVAGTDTDPSLAGTGVVANHQDVEATRV